MNKPDREELLEKAERLEEIKEEIAELLGEAEDLVQGTNAEPRASAYWLAHMRMALDDDHGYLGSGGSTIEEAIQDIREEAEGEEEE